MNLKSLYLFHLLSIPVISYSQVDSMRIDSFVIEKPKKVSESLYSSIQYLDNRGEDTLNLGYIIEEKNLSSVIQYYVKPGYALSQQFSNLIDSISLSIPGNGKLILQLGRLKFSEERTKQYEQRFFLFRANLYSVTKNGIFKLDAIDTIAVFKNKKSKNLLAKYHKFASDIINAFIVRNLSKATPDSPEYFTTYEVERIDSIDKSHMDLYSLDTLVDGVYLSYESLKNQLPKYTDFEARIKDSTLMWVKKRSYRADDDMDYTIDGIYAVVKDSKVFIFIDHEFYLLEKRNGDFYFTRKIDFGTNTTPGDIIRATSTPMRITGGSAYGLGFGILTLFGDLFNKTTRTTYEFKLDHLDGSFIPTKEIKDRFK